MSISAALSAALSGLTATSRMAEVTASNVSNALTEGYARREVQLSGRIVGTTGLGVHIDGVTRQIDPILLRDLRLSSAVQGGRTNLSDFWTALEKTLGTADQASSITGRISALESSLVAAQSRPESEARLAAIADAARSLTQGLQDASDDVQVMRQDADRAIATLVAQINSAAQGIADLNLRIREFKYTGRDTTGLMDQRQKLVDQISNLVPVKEIQREHDQIALYTTGGTMLVDGRPAKLDYTPAGIITPDMTLASGALSGLSVNGHAISTTPRGGLLGEGGLSAQFAIRDKLATDAQAQLDAVARDLIERFTAPGLDPTASPGDPGLFTDAGASFVAANEVGLAGRIAVNTLIQPENGGALFRLREGLGAAAPALPGYAGQLAAWSAALSDKHATASGGFPTGARSLSELATEMLSVASTKRLAAEADTSFAAARSDGLRNEMLKDGVDSDQEMQNLLLIEQAYAANAKVIQTMDDLIKILMGM
jgi:flagellar hook-associated protein 1